MTEQEFIDYIEGYGTHVGHVYGDDQIVKNVDLTPYNSNASFFNCKTSNGEKHYMRFKINGKEATIKECVDLINRYQRDKKLLNILKQMIIEKSIQTKKIHHVIKVGDYVAHRIEEQQYNQLADIWERIELKWKVGDRNGRSPFYTVERHAFFDKSFPFNTSAQIEREFQLNQINIL